MLGPSRWELSVRRSHLPSVAGVRTNQECMMEDQYLVGDWDGDGKNTLAVRRGNQVIFQAHIGDGSGTQGGFGEWNAEDEYLVGDWDGDGKDTLAVRRGNQVIFQAHIGDGSGTQVGFGDGAI